MAKARAIQPLHGGFGGYIETLVDIRGYVEAERPSTKEDLESWYARRFKTPIDNAERYINSLFRCGLLTKESDHIVCAFPRNRHGAARHRLNRSIRDRKIIETIDDNVEFILDMLNEARDGASEDELASLAKSKYGLTSNVGQIRQRRGWLQSAGMLEKKGKRLYATDAGRQLLQERDVRSAGSRTSVLVNRAEFGGEGEGVEHKTLKEYVHKNCERILSEISGQPVDVISREMECELPSGDRVDVTARNEEVIWHIEVKSRISTESDIRRGLYQCVKYKAVEEVRQRVDRSNGACEVKSLLVVENELSRELKEHAKSVPVQCYVVGRLPARRRRPS